MDQNVSTEQQFFVLLQKVVFPAETLANKISLNIFFVTISVKHKMRDC